MVYKVKRNSDGKVYALKKVNSHVFLIPHSQVKMLKLSDKERQNALNEVRILASIEYLPFLITHRSLVTLT